MGFKQNKNTPPMEREINYLLYDLCVYWGFCIPPIDADVISTTKHWSAKDFATAVVVAEGMDPECEYSWVKKISNRFCERFGSEEIYYQSFIDRVRGNKEQW
jgi:hypothetical protein